MLAPAATGAALALLFAFATVRLGADQIIVGAALNLLALGVTGALYRALLGVDRHRARAADPAGARRPRAPARPAARHGPVRQHALVYLGLCLTPVLAFVLAHTGLGLRLRALGDHPLAAASLGLPVRSYRTAVARRGRRRSPGSAAPP